MPEVTSAGRRNVPAATTIVAAVGAVAVGAVAVAALAIRRFAIGQLAVNRAAFNTVEIAELTITRLGGIRTLAESSDNGIVNTPSHHSVAQTVENLKAILQASGVALFAVVDHSGEAAKIGMSMRPTTLLIFGNPKAGTPLMLAAPSCAIDLPLKVLIWEDGNGKVWMSHNSGEYLQKRHNLPHSLLQNVAGVQAFIAKAGGSEPDTVKTESPG